MNSPNREKNNAPPKSIPRIEKLLKNEFFY